MKKVHPLLFMSEDMHESISRFYHCDCCMFYSSEPGRKCSCVDDVCQNCKRCSMHCSCPQESRAYYGGEQIEVAADALDRLITADDVTWLKNLRVGWY